jgi:ribose transport system permease protein
MSENPLTGAIAATLGLPRLQQHRGLFIAIGVFIVMFVVLNFVSAAPLGYFDVQILSSSSATLALAAIGQTIIILTGGFDLSAGAVISLVNVILATQMGESVASQALFSAVVLAVGAAAGAFNGFFVAFMRLPPIVVTLASMFIVQGFTLLVLDQPGGSFPASLSTFLTGDAIPDGLPAGIVVLLIALTIWLLIRRSRFGTAIYAIGGDEEAARANGVKIVRAKFTAYVVAGVFYGAAGLYLTANSGAGDPLVGNPMLLRIFAAVVLGGVLLGGGRGGCVGPVFAAFTLMMIVNALLILSVSAYYSTLVEGVILVLAVLGGALHRNAPIATSIRLGLLRLRSLADASASVFLRGTDRRLAEDALGGLARAPFGSEPLGPSWQRFVIRNAETLRYTVPAYLLALVVIAVTAGVHGGGMSAIGYVNSLLVLTSFLAVLGLGQGAVILSGGLDLSVPWAIAFTGALLTGLTDAAQGGLAWAIPVVLCAGIALGVVNGVGIVLFGLPPIVMTLAMNGILQGATLVFSHGTPVGIAPMELQWFMSGSLGGLAPAAWFAFAFVAGATLLLGRTTFGRRIYAVGNSQTAARLSGVGVGETLIGVYALSGFCAAIVGMMLVGFTTMATLGMGDPFLLPSIAIVVVGGTLITGGRGHYLGIVGGALLLTALSTLLAGTTVPFAVRDIIYGVVVLGAILALRERAA